MHAKQLLHRDLDVTGVGSGVNFCRYEILDYSSEAPGWRKQRTPDEQAKENATLLEQERKHYLDFEIAADRIAFGSDPREELCLTQVSERSANVLRGEALQRDGSGETLVRFWLQREAELVRFRYSLLVLDPSESTPVVLRRKP